HSMAHVKSADLVAIRIAQVGTDRLVGRTFARSRRAFAGATGSEPRLMPAAHRLVVGGGEAQSAAVSEGGRLPIVRLADDEGAARSGIYKLARFPGNDVLVTEPGHRRIVELAALLDVVRAKESVGEHKPLLQGGA